MSLFNYECLRDSHVEDETDLFFVAPEGIGQIGLNYKGYFD